jgi:hypothetical protein
VSKAYVLTTFYVGSLASCGRSHCRRFLRGARRVVAVAFSCCLRRTCALAAPKSGLDQRGSTMPRARFTAVSSWIDRSRATPPESVLSIHGPREVSPPGDAPADAGSVPASAAAVTTARTRRDAPAQGDRRGAAERLVPQR